jgi:hypothetical protein
VVAWVIEVREAHLTRLAGGSILTLRDAKREMEFRAAEAHAHIRRRTGRQGVHGIHDHVGDASLNGVDEVFEAGELAAKQGGSEFGVLRRDVGIEGHGVVRESSRRLRMIEAGDEGQKEDREAAGLPVSKSGS